jgi:hypothetical protein
MLTSSKTKNLIAIIILLLAFFRLLLLSRPVTVDDPFITFRYAHNIANNNGFVYNEGEHWLGTTTPFYALLLSFFGIFTDNLPKISQLLGLLSFLGTILIIYLLFRKMNLDIVGLLAGFSFVSAPLISRLYGFETPFYIFLIFLCFYVYHIKRYYLLAVLFAILLLTRPDGIALIAVLTAHYIIVNKRFPLYPFLLFVLLLLPWIIFGFFYFGSPVPETVSAKVAQGQSSIWQVGFGEILINYCLSHPLVPVLALFGIISAFFSHLWLIPIALWLFAYSLGFTIAGVPADYGWYFAPLIPAAAIFVFVDIVDRIKHLMRARERRVGNYIIYTVLIAFLMFMTYRAVKNRMLFQPEKYDLRYNGYTEISRWLNHNVEEDRTIAASEVGILGYNCPNLRFVDFCGLITPDVAERLKQTTSLPDFGDWFIHTFDPDLVLLFEDERWNNTGIDQDSRDFRNDYEFVKNFRTSEERWSWNLYKKKKVQ